MTSTADSRLRRPAAARLPLVDTLHGQQVADPYRWLEDPLADSTTRWRAEQDELYNQARDGWSAREPLLGRLTELFSAGYLSPPQAYGDRLFYNRLDPGQEYAALVVRIDGAERAVFDPLSWDPSGRSTLEAWQPSWSGELVAIQLSLNGAEDSRLLVLRVDTGEIVDGPIDRVRKSAIGWLPDGSGFYYVRRLAPELNPGEENYHRRVYLHLLGSHPDEDVLIFGDGRDRTEFYSVEVDRAGSLLVLTASVGSGAGSIRDIWIAELDPANAGRLELRAVQEGLRCRSTVCLGSAAAAPNPLYLHTDYQASRGRVVTVAAVGPAADWAELVAQDPVAVITDLAILDGVGLPAPLAMVSRRRHAVSEIELFDLTDGSSRGLLALPGPGVTGRVSVSVDGRHAWFSFADPGRSPIVLDFDAGTGVLSQWGSTARAAAGISLITRQLSFGSKDGTEVRMFVLSAAGYPDRPRPTILTGYGGFGAVLAPGYRAEALAWVERGGVFAIAGLRGGGEEGAQWHLAGTVLAKQNVFDDFDAATDCLLEQGWTDRESLGIIGGSNGGLLIGAAITQHPEKYAAAVCQAPLLDMVRYQLAGLGPSWQREYGSVSDPLEFANLLRYSPYHAVRDGVEYPAVLFAVFDGDSRVDPLHARKMCAALQHASGSVAPILLRDEHGVGHGARTVSSGANLFADCLAFLADRLERP